MIFTRVCESCKHKKRIYNRREKGQSGATVTKVYVDCKILGKVEAPSEIRKRTKKSLCKQYESTNATWVLDIDKWIWREVNSFGE